MRNAANNNNPSRRKHWAMSILSVVKCLRQWTLAVTILLAGMACAAAQAQPVTGEGKPLSRREAAAALAAVQRAPEIQEGQSRIFLCTNSILRMPATGTAKQMLVENVGTCLDLEVDLAGGKIYWAQRSPQRIRRANLDGSYVEDVIRPTMPLVAMAIDKRAGKLYWLVTIRDAKSFIRRADLDGTNVEDVLSMQSTADDLALDTGHGHLYWCSSSTLTIHRANLDGTGVHDVIDFRTMANMSDFQPRNILVDSRRNRLWFSSLEFLCRSALDGTGVERIVDEPILGRCLALDGRAERVYWVPERRWGVIRSCRTNGKDVRTFATGRAPAALTVIAPPPAALESRLRHRADTSDAPKYDLVDLGSLGGDRIEPTAINNEGDIVGWGETAEGHKHAFLYRAATGLRDLGTLGGDASVAYDINDDGIIVGVSATADTIRVMETDFPIHSGFVVDSNEKPIRMQRVSDRIASCRSLRCVNSQGVALGEVDTTIVAINLADMTTETPNIKSGPLRFASAMSERGNMLFIGNRRNRDNSGDVILASRGRTGWNAVMVPRLAEHMTYTGYGVNDAGVVVGGAHDATGDLRAFRCDTAASPLQTKTLETLGGVENSATAINDRGDIVGWSHRFPLGPDRTRRHAFLYSDASGMQDLNDLIRSGEGWHLLSAVDINNTGQIVGTAEHDGETKAFLLTPVSDEKAGD